MGSQVSCASGHSLFLTSEGRVFSCGFGNRGVLGTGTINAAAVLTPTELTEFVTPRGEATSNAV